MNRLSFSLLALVLAAGVPLMAGCGEGQAASDAGTTERRFTRIETLALEPQAFEDRIEITGSVEALDDATLSAQATGTVEALKDLGTFVNRGAVVAQINPQEARAAVDQARAAVESAQAQYDLADDRYQRQEPLYRDSIISAQEFENVRSQRAQAQASLAQARAQLSQSEERQRQTTVTSPFAGTVEERFVELGEQVRSGDQVARVVNTQRVKITAGAPERYAGDIERGTPVTLSIRGARSIEDREARVTFVGSAIDPQSRTFPIEVTVDNPGGRLKPAMVVDMEVPREEIEDALVIPRTAVIRDEEGTKVFVVESAGPDSNVVARERSVTLGPANGERVVVESGLERGARIVVLGQTNVAPGDTVAIARQYDRLPEAGSSFGSAQQPQSNPGAANPGTADSTAGPDVPGPSAPGSPEN